jgi:hypothetical protein
VADAAIAVQATRPSCVKIPLANVLATGQAPRSRVSIALAAHCLIESTGRLANDLIEQNMPCNANEIGLGTGAAARLKELRYDI